MSATAVAFLPGRAEQREGVTYTQAMEVFDRYFTEGRCQAVPTIAHEMDIPYEIACRVLGGLIWPAAYRYWLDRVLP